MRRKAELPPTSGAQVSTAAYGYLAGQYLQLFTGVAEINGQEPWFPKGNIQLPGQPCEAETQCGTVKPAPQSYLQQTYAFLASALLVSLKNANAKPARPAPNLLSACRRVVDWANPLVSSSNFSFMAFPSSVEVS